MYLVFILEIEALVKYSVFDLCASNFQQSLSSIAIVGNVGAELSES